MIIGNTSEINVFFGFVAVVVFIILFWIIYGIRKGGPCTFISLIFWLVLTVSITENLQISSHRLLNDSNFNCVFLKAQFAIHKNSYISHMRINHLTNCINIKFSSIVSDYYYNCGKLCAFCLQLCLLLFCNLSFCRDS
jgi:hypothetical protein